MSGRLRRHVVAVVLPMLCLAAGGCTFSRAGYVQVWGERGVQVWLDGEPAGTIRATPGDVLIEDVPPGLHRVVLRREGHIRQEGPVFVQAGEVAVFRAQPFRPPQTVITTPANAKTQTQVVLPRDANGTPVPHRIRPVGGAACRPLRTPRPSPAGMTEAKSPEPPRTRRRPVTTVYTVRKGDTLISIAKRFGTTPEQVRLADRRTGDRIYPGERLKVLKEKPRIVVHKRSFRLKLYVADELVKEYQVCVGRGDLTPTGVYEIVDKVKRPDWYRKGRRYRYGDPRNILGTRWMTLVREGHGREGYGIHGTTLPGSVPGDGSLGCVRMLNRDVEELFAWTPRGTRVVIEDD